MGYLWGTPEERFWRFVDKGAGPGSCWGWRGSTRCFNNGYGGVRVGTKKIPAHRLSYQLNKGKIPEGMCVLHTCDNPPCTNPAHLILGTHLTNMRDMYAKDRRQAARGSKNGWSKLTEDDIKTIRASASCKRQTEIAEEFDVTKSAIWSIVHRKTWKHVD